MVSNAREDFPDPLSPVITVSVLRGTSTSMFFRLCWRAPRTVILLIAIWKEPGWPNLAVFARVGLPKILPGSPPEPKAMYRRNMDGHPLFVRLCPSRDVLRILVVNSGERQRG